MPNVLHGISFDVQPREKIGIVGATGCGKSTLALSFFRFVEATAGRIVIDGLGARALLHYRSLFNDLQISRR
jgi:ABC-type multidrug transport system fused ATPase/permease subunit